MNAKAWVRNILRALFLLGTVAAAALWIAALTAKCEGFGCLGVGAMVAMAVAVQCFSAIAGGILIWLQKLEGRIPIWLLTIEVLHSLPVLWFAGRMALS